jgi:hypothetical protein
VDWRLRVTLERRGAESGQDDLNSADQRQHVDSDNSWEYDRVVYRRPEVRASVLAKRDLALFGEKAELLAKWLREQIAQDRLTR